ncbi:MAG: pyridoxal phosphate-dependent aminotransferase [Thermoanaerobaculia bacterium]|nr:pyridoxal phosphate-dependent aminotransferase [Thermoanaerobaculia bacterium]
MDLSARVRRIGESATLKVTRRAMQMKAQGIDVIDFGAGEPDFASPAVAVEAARKALADGFTKYTQNQGIPALRQALAKRYAGQYGAPWNADQTLITVGGKGALFELALALFEEGQEVVVHTPAWVSIPEQIRFAGATVVEVPTSGADGFAVDPEAMLAAITSRTRAVILNSPCNPTGGMISPAALAAIVEGCAARGVLVISDETYERFVYDGQRPFSAAALAGRFPDTVVVVGSFSKTYAMTGWRLGYLLGPRELTDAAATIQGHATSNATSFAMVGALAALEHAEPEVEAMITEYEARRNVVVPRLNALPGFSCLPPSGAFYAFPDVSACFRTDDSGEPEGSTRFAERLLEEAHVAVVAGSAFGGDNHIRISFACSRENLAEGFRRIEEFLARG